MSGLEYRLKNRRVRVHRIKGGWHIESTTLHKDAPEDLTCCMQEIKYRGDLAISEIAVRFSDEAMEAIFMMIHELNKAPDPMQQLIDAVTELGGVYGETADGNSDT